MSQSSHNVRKPKTIVGNEIAEMGILCENPLDHSNPNFISLCTHLCQDVDSIRKELPEEEVLQIYGSIIDQTAADFERIYQQLGEAPTILAADAYYMKAKMVEKLQKKAHCILISKMRKDAVGYEYPQPKEPGKRGPQAKIGQKIKLMDLFDDEEIKFKEATIILYGKKQKVRYYCTDLLWNKESRFNMRFVLVDLLDENGEVENRSILGCTDQSIAPLTIIRAYAWRTKIELFFRDCNQHMGLEDYHFWSEYQPKFRPREKGTPPLSDSVEGPEAREALARCLKRNETHFLICTLAYGITQLVALEMTRRNIKEEDIIYKRTYSKKSISIWMAQLFIKNLLFSSAG